MLGLVTLRLVAQGIFSHPNEKDHYTNLMPREDAVERELVSVVSSWCLSYSVSANMRQPSTRHRELV